MKKIEWKKNFRDHFHSVIQETQFEPGATGFAVYKDINVYLEITEKQNDSTYYAVVIRFDPSSPKLSDLNIGDNVEVGVQHFNPN